MFGSKESKIARLIKKGKWEVLSKKYLNSDTETKILLARECAKANEPGVNSLLSTLTRDSDPKVQLEAVKALTITGRDHEVAQLQWLLTQVPAENKEMVEAIEHAIGSCRGRR
ncbi:MAG: HEAT repeat domain-containing protein [Clostridiaceae bacterium]|nr:HEAT repeat domain-containing protein [Clostridiaceae bacterium]